MAEDQFSLDIDFLKAVMFYKWSEFSKNRKEQIKGFKTWVTNTETKLWF